MKYLIFTLFFFLLTSAAFATQNKKMLKLRLQAASGELSDATLYFDQGITAAYNIHEDAEMVFDTVPGVPELYSFTTDNVPCSINGCGILSTSTVTQLGYHVTSNGLYTLSAILVDNFDPTTIIRLVDKQAGVTTDLRENFYQVQLDSADLAEGRFSIMVSSPVQYSSQNSNCANNGGMITVIPDSSITWSLCQLYDSTNQLLATDSDVAGVVTFTGLSAGSYNVILTYSQYTTSSSFYVGGNYVVADIGVPNQKIYTNEDVVFNGQATNADQFSWSFGDGTLIEGVDNPDQTYLVPGVYTIQFTCSNALGCSASATATITVYQATATGVNEPTKNENVTLITKGKTITANMNDIVLSNNAVIIVYNLLGQAVSTSAIDSPVESLNLDKQANGYYLVSIKNGGAVNTKRVFLQN